MLSISSLFAVGMMVGWNINIERQRYNDTVNTLKSDIQGIFNEVENPTNSRGDISCLDNGENVGLRTTGSLSSRGTSRCILLGKLVIFGDGTSGSIGGSPLGQYSQDIINVVDVVGLDIDSSNACGGPCNNHIDALRATKFVFDYGAERVSNPKVINLQWSGTYKLITDNRDTGGGNRLFRSSNDWQGFGQNSTGSVANILILRSPIDNTVISFALPGNTITESFLDNTSRVSIIRRLVLDHNLTLNVSRKFDVCVRNSGASRFVAGEAIFGRNKVIRIGGSAAAVEIAPLDGPGSVSCGNGIGFDDVSREG